MSEEESITYRNIDSIIPESLLAFAKDSRYIRQCQELLQQVFRSELSTTDFWWWSVLLYSTLVVAKRKRTWGMEFVGLQHANVTPWQARVAKLLLASAWALWLRQILTLERFSLLENIDEQQEQRHERLRGEARQYFYQQQRRAMMQRATRANDGEALSSSDAASTEVANEPSSNDFVKRIKLLAKRLAQSLSEAVSSVSDHPHSLPDTSNLISIGRWVARLHLAHYCITGRYPTLWHMLLNANVKRQNDSSRIANPPPPTHVALVGKLILIQAGANLLQKCAQWVASYIASKQRIEQRQSREHDADAVDTPAGLSSSSLQLCAICRSSRKHSAVPSACGHVFCWKCLHHWVSTVRPECPLCRAVCQPQDILALHNY